jgi:CO/xanthine dehydrogenase Mo-binding subunit
VARDDARRRRLPLQAVHVDTQVVYTNNGYSGAFRGFGNIQAGAAIELAIDELAEQLGRDPSNSGSRTACARATRR